MCVVRLLIKRPRCNLSWFSSTPTFTTPESLIISQNIYYQVFNVTSLCQPLLPYMCFVNFCIILTNLMSWRLNSIFICQSSFIIAFQIIIFLVCSKNCSFFLFFFSLNEEFSVSQCLNFNNEHTLHEYGSRRTRGCLWGMGYSIRRDLTVRSSLKNRG